jgi:hypothetical protein
MSPDLLILIIASLGWLVLVGASLASYRLKWSQMLKMALMWLAIFVGLYVLVEWFMVARGTASALI